MKLLDRARLRSLVPSAKLPPEAAARLAAAPADALVDLVLDAGEPWWRRQPCARALAGRVPPDGAAALLALACDPNGHATVRATVLAVLADPRGPVAAPLLAWLRAQEGVEQPYGLDLALPEARAALADLSAAPSLAALAADAWTHRRAVGEAALDALIAARGLDAVLAALGAGSPWALASAGTRPADRLLGLRLLRRAGADLTPCLADPAVIVARRAAELLAEATGDDAALWAVVAARGPGHLWALGVLRWRGHDIRAAWADLGRPRVEVPGVPDEVRAAIVRAYAPGERETDVRWLLEAACLDPAPELDDEEAMARRAVAALAAAGLQPKAPLSAGELHRQGGGTYHRIDTAAGALTVSALGPFYALEAAEADPRIAAAMAAAGFRRIDAPLGGLIFEGLHVYFFGHREPLSVADLLFYWQD